MIQWSIEIHVQGDWRGREDLASEIVRFLNTAEARERLFSTGSEAAGGSPQQLAATIASDRAKLGKVIKDAGIRAD